jgi:hypothetical protein
MDGKTGSPVEQGQESGEDTRSLVKKRHEIDGEMDGNVQMQRGTENQTSSLVRTTQEIDEETSLRFEA